MCICSCIPAFFLHVENVARVDPTEVEEVEEEYQEEQQEFEVAEQVENQVHETNFANSDPQQGKPRFIYPSVLHKFKLYASTDA